MSSLDVLLGQAGPSGVFLRFVRRLTGRDDLFAVRGRCVVGSGLRAGIYVAPAHWLFAPDADDGDALLADIVTEAFGGAAGATTRPSGAGLSFGVEAAEPMPSSREASAVYRVGPGSGPPGWERTIDRVFVGDGRPSEVRTVAGDAFLSSLDRLDPELAPRVPPPQILARLPFRFHGLEYDGQLVAMCDTTVDDGEYVAIQQVHTVERLRGRGLGAALLGSVLGWAHGFGRRVVYVCDERNEPSAALARTVGLALHAEVPLFTPD
ncbi:MAG: GNAT family N-acetyltransferase [Myxococcota bacterium]